MSRDIGIVILRPLSAEEKALPQKDKLRSVRHVYLITDDQKHERI